MESGQSDSDLLHGAEYKLFVDLIEAEFAALHFQEFDEESYSEHSENETGVKDLKDDSYTEWEVFVIATICAPKSNDFTLQGLHQWCC
jgi:hypothetical protein